MTATGLTPWDGVTEPHSSPSLVLELCQRPWTGQRQRNTLTRKDCPVPRLTVHMTNTHLDHVLDAAVGMLLNH